MRARERCVTARATEVVATSAKICVSLDMRARERCVTARATEVVATSAKICVSLDMRARERCVTARATAVREASLEAPHSAVSSSRDQTYQRTKCPGR
jgi:hypothetical protein